MTTNAATLSPASTSVALLPESRSAKLISLVVSSVPASGAVNAVKVGRSAAPVIVTVNRAVVMPKVGLPSPTPIVNVSLTVPPGNWLMKSE